MRRAVQLGQMPRDLQENVRHEAKEETDDLTDVILARVGPGAEGGRERRRDWNGGLQQPSGLNCPRRRCAPRRATEGAKVKHARSMSSHVEVGVGTLCTEQKLAVARACSQSPVAISADWVCPSWVRRRPVPIGRRSALPGVKPTTYRTTGFSFEHGNLDPSAEPAKLRQAAKSGDVSDEGRSLRSSRSAGKPRTWRREAVMGTASKPPGKAMYVAPRARLGLAPERAAQAVRAK